MDSNRGPNTMKRYNILGVMDHGLALITGNIYNGHNTKACAQFSSSQLPRGRCSAVRAMSCSC